jgi:hypothetical protein
LNNVAAGSSVKMNTEETKLMALEGWNQQGARYALTAGHWNELTLLSTCMYVKL